MRYRRVTSLWLLALWIAVLFLTSAESQTSPPASPVIGVFGITHSAANLDRTLAFYQEVFGFELAQPVRRGLDDPSGAKVTDTPGAKFSIAWLRVPGSNFTLEFIEFSGVERKNLPPPRQTDPGVAELNLRVRNIQPVLAALKKAGAPIITLGGMPIKFNRNGTETLHIFVRDPDGFILEVTQAPAPEGAPASNVYNGVIGMTTADTEKSMRFYRDLFGFPLTVGARWIDDKNIMRMVGAEVGQIRQSQGTIPGSDARYEFYEYKGVQQTPFRSRIQDPGTAWLALQVRDMKQLYAKLKEGGVPIVTDGGEPIDRENFGIFLMVRDPNGMIVELVQLHARR